MHSVETRLILITLQHSTLHTRNPIQDNHVAGARLLDMSLGVRTAIYTTAHTHFDVKFSIFVVGHA
jgi:hypothetical protein